MALMWTLAPPKICLPVCLQFRLGRTVHWCVVYLCLPGVNFLSNLLELSEGVVLCGPQHTLQVIDTVGDSYCHLLTFWSSLRTLVQSGMESNGWEWGNKWMNEKEYKLKGGGRAERKREREEEGRKVERKRYGRNGREIQERHLPFTDLPDPVSKLISLEEQDEHNLVFKLSLQIGHMTNTC